MFESKLDISNGDSRLLKEYDLLNPDDAEIVLYDKFKLWRQLTTEESVFIEQIMTFLRNSLGPSSENFWHMCYDIVVCPSCLKKEARYFHGHKVTYGIEHPNILFHQDSFDLSCSCGYSQREAESMSFNHIDQRVQFMPKTKIPLYSGLFVKNLSQD